MAYSNSIGLAQKFVPLLDEVYKASARTSVLDVPAFDVKFDGANIVKLFGMTMDGLGNYSRNAGFVDGSVTGTWTAYELTQDRGRGFQIDAMDNEETAGQAFGRLAGEFVRTEVAPEIDAYRVAKLAGTTGITTGTAADITVGTTDVAGLLDAAERQMDEDEVPYEGRICLISETAYAGLKAKIDRTVMNRDAAINNGIITYGDHNMRLVRMPQNRMYTKITLNDGTTAGQTAGGYVPTHTTGYKVNFMIVHPSAVAPVVKHEVPRIFAPDVNQQADAWLFQYRIYHDLFVKANKKKGVYLHRGATAIPAPEA